MTSKGEVIPEEDQDIIWVEEVLKWKYGQKNVCINNPITVELPLNAIALTEVVTSLMKTVHHNTMAGIFAIGMYENGEILVYNKIIYMPFC